MTGLLILGAFGAVASASPQAAGFLRVAGVSDPMYVVEGSIVENDGSTLVTIITPLDEMGLMSMRIEMDCAARKYRPLVVSFYNQDGSPRSSTGAGENPGPPIGWATRNAAEIAAVVCR